MKKIAGALCLAALAVPALAQATTTTYYSGQFCYGSLNIRPDDQGVLNAYNQDYPVYCPASWSTSAPNGQGNALVAVDAATVVYSDNSSGAFNCHVVQENWDGSVFSSASLYSCSTYGGCTSNSNGAYQGSGQLNFTAPISGGAGFYATSIALSCEIPGSSVIRGYNFSIN
jgi:hypothetical protein